MTDSEISSSDSPTTSTEPSQPPVRVKRKYVRKAKPEPEPVPTAGHFGHLLSDDIDMEPVKQVRPTQSLALQLARQFGLEPGLGTFCRIVKRGDREAFVLGYTGLLSLALGSGELITLDARSVSDKDKFALDYGRQLLEHAPWEGIEGAGPLTGAYAQSVDKRGIRQIAFVPARDIKARADAMWIDGMTAEEVFRKVALMDLIAYSPLPLVNVRLAMEAERSMTA